MKFQIRKWLFGETSNNGNCICDDLIVAAGNPRKKMDAVFSPIEMNAFDKSIVEGLDEREISGFSMSPCEIDNEDHVFSRKVANFAQNDFLIISVDEEYYKNEGLPIYAQYKLRRFLMEVSHSMTLGEVETKLATIQREICLPFYQENLKRKFEKVKSAYPMDDLCLSYTFKNGEFRYSFHPTHLVEGKVEYVLSHKYHTLKRADAIKPYI